MELIKRYLPYISICASLKVLNQPDIPPPSLLSSPVGLSTIRQYKDIIGLPLLFIISDILSGDKISSKPKKGILDDQYI